MDPGELAAALRELRDREDERLRGDFDRSLAFADGLFDRWARAERLGFGSEASIYDSAQVYGDVRVGEATWIGPYTLLDGSGATLEIGHHCSVSTAVQIYTHDTVAWALTGGRAVRSEARVTVGSCTHIGAASIVAAGVEIGDHSVVGANSFVNTSFPAYSIVVGSPARRVGEVVTDGDHVELRYQAGHASD